jgi:dCTP diphosphatase
MHKQRQVPSSLAAHWGYVLIACLRHNGPGITGKYTMTEAMETPAPDTLVTLRARLADFAAQRDWDQFHSPKNLAMALIAETAELVEYFQWLTEEQSQQLPSVKLAEVRLELADILIYLIRIADKLNVDLTSAALEKIAINEQRYPVDRVRGDARRAEEYPTGE